VTIDPDLVVGHLNAAGLGGRRHIDDVAVAVQALNPYLDPALLPELLGDLVHRGQQQGLWTAARSASVTRGRTVLPKFITLPRTAAPRDTLGTVGVPLRPELASWAASLPMTRGQREVIVAVNEWLRRTDGGDTPVVEAAERAYELLGDEKSFDNHPPRGGAALWAPNRLTLQFLRCQRTPTPLTWEPVTPVVGQPGPILCVENHATFRTMLRGLRQTAQPRWMAVAWVQGRNTAPLESLPDLPFTITRLDYLGDFDPAGLSIAITVCETVTRIGIAAGPAGQLWTRLLQQPDRPGPSTSDADAYALTAWLPPDLHNRARELLITGRAIPQEALRIELLTGELG
jgi:hypothetical protein